MACTVGVVMEIMGKRRSAKMARNGYISQFLQDLSGAQLPDVAVPNGSADSFDADSIDADSFDTDSLDADSLARAAWSAEEATTEMALKAISAKKIFISPTIIWGERQFYEGNSGIVLY